MFCFTACSRKGDKQVPIVERDTSITRANAYNDVFFDSLKLEIFLQEEGITDTSAQHIRNFYNERNYQYAWFSEEGMGEFVPTFLAMQEDYISYSGDSSLRDIRLQRQLDSLQHRKDFHLHDSLLLHTELLMTKQFFNYASRAFDGKTNINTKDLGWYIPRKKINTVAFLDSLIRNKGKDVSRYEPVNRQYNLLKNYLLKYYALQKAGSWKHVPELKVKVLRVGDSSESIAAIKSNLIWSGDLEINDSTEVFTELLKKAVIAYQLRQGLSPDGEIGPAFMREINKPVTERIRQILINMERIRWMPADPQSDYLLVNIPEFKLHVYEAGALAFNMNVVVGSTANNTVIFSGNLKHVVFSPYWNVPNSILKNEVLPGIKRNSNYLANHNMEWHNGYVRQKPGPKNSLGLVKFLFPNSYSIYLHDTPSKSLFGESRRAFSHGCIRLSDPKALAEFLLRKDTAWTSAKIDSAMHSGQEKYVTVRPEVPVIIGYFTAWVDRDNKINFRPDVYGHDQKMAEKLF